MSNQQLEDTQQQVRMVSVDLIEKVWFGNPNVMTEEEFESLKKDMELRGTQTISPISIVDKRQGEFPGQKAQEKPYVAADGNHRLGAAIALHWKEIPAILDPTIRTEEDLRLVNYRKNLERGRIDPTGMKEAELFTWLHDVKGKSQEEIATLSGMDRTTVSKRMSLLKVEPEVVQSLKKFTQQVNASQLEVLSPLEPELQKEVVGRLISANKYEGKFEDRQARITVSAVQETAKDVVKDYKEWKRLESALKSPETKKALCPKCDTAAVEIAYNDLPWVKDEKDHIWNLKTGQTLLEFEKEQSLKRESKYEKEVREKRVEALQKAREEPDFIRVEQDIPSFIKVGLLMAQNAIRDADYLSEIKLYGKAKDGGNFVVVVSEASESAVMDFKVGKSKQFSLSLEKKHYAKTSDLAKFKTVVRSGQKTLRSDKDREEFSEEISKLFKKYDRSETSENEMLTSEEVEALKKLRARLKAGGNTGQLQALMKLEVLAGA